MLREKLIDVKDAAAFAKAVLAENNAEWSDAVTAYRRRAETEK